jgi:hypothetical protein
MLSKRYWKENFVFLTLSAYAEHADTGLTIPQAVAKGLVHRDDYKVDLKQLIKEVEREALKQEKGLVILSGDVAKMGISLPCVDVVFMMGNNPDADDIIQKMYRALTDDPPLKKDGFIVDLNLKRIVTAMFDYDLEKDRLRTTAIKLPSIEDRAIRLFNLCDWGQDGFIEDNTGITFDDVMGEIKKRIVDDLRKKVLYNHSIDKIRASQLKSLNDDPDLWEKIQAALREGKKGKGRTASKATPLMTLGAHIPGGSAGGAAAAAAAGAGEDGSGNGPEEGAGDGAAAAAAAKPVAPDLTDKQQRELWINISQTFVNTLVVKSAELLSDESMNLVALIQKYRKDKEESVAEPVCECGGSGTANNCLKSHDNLYEIVYCEMRAFAIDKDGKLDRAKMARIMDLIDATFALPPVEWNIYIEEFIGELRRRVANRGRRITRRNKRRNPI